MNPSLALAEWVGERLRLSELFGSRVYLTEPPPEQDPAVPCVAYLDAEADWGEPLSGEEWSEVRVISPQLEITVAAAPDTTRAALVAAEAEAWRLLMSRTLEPARPRGMLGLVPGATAYSPRTGNYAVATLTFSARFFYEQE